MSQISSSRAAWPTLLAAAASLALPGCAGAPPLRTADTALPGTFTRGSESFEPATLDRWWLVYDDAQLTALIDGALGEGFETRLAFARLQEARAVRAGALAQYGLQGNLTGNAQIQRSERIAGGSSIDIPGFDLGSLGLGSSTTTTGSLTLPVSWEIDLLGRNAAARTAADADLAAARFDYEGVRSAVAAEIARSLFQARGLATQLDDARASAQIQQRLFDLLSKRADRGLAARSEADRVQADLAQAEAQAADLAGALDATKRALLVLVGKGIEPVSGIMITASIPAPPVVPAAVPGALLQRRPDIREADARLRAASGNVRLAELDFFPRLTLQPTAGLSYTSGGLGGLSAIAGIGAGLTAPLFDRPRLKSQLGISSARAEQALLAYEQNVQTAYSEADQALIRLATDRQRIEILERGTAAAQRSYDAALKRFELGFSDLQAVLDAERAWRSTRTALTAAKLDGLLRSVQAFQALGGGWDALSPDMDMAR